MLVVEAAIAGVQPMDLAVEWDVAMNNAVPPLAFVRDASLRFARSKAAKAEEHRAALGAVARDAALLQVSKDAAAQASALLQLREKAHQKSAEAEASLRAQMQRQAQQPPHSARAKHAVQ